MRFQHFFLTFSLVVAVAGILGAVGLASRAEYAEIRMSYQKIAGTYQCWKTYSGSIGASCGIQPPLVFNPDGTYRHGEETGRFFTDPSARVISLQQSSIKGNGILRDETITFTARFQDTDSTTVYTRDTTLP